MKIFSLACSWLPPGLLLFSSTLPCLLFSSISDHREQVARMRDCFCGDDNREYTCRYCITSKLRQNPTPTENISNADDSSPTLSASAGTFRHGRQSYTINEAAERHASMPARVLSQSLISNGAALQSARYSINASAARSASATQRSRPGFPSRTPRAHQAPSNVDVVPELSITFQTAQGTRTQLVDEIGLPLSIEYKVHELIKHSKYRV